MSLMSKVMGLFPVLHLVSSLGGLAYFVNNFGVIGFLGLIAGIFGLPLAAYHLHQIFYPLRKGYHNLSAKEYCPWWGTYQIQALFLAVPVLEGCLKIIPGAYSAWLRLWGSSIGKGVVWTPQVEIIDRGMLVVGDHAVFGHRSLASGHIISQRGGRAVAYVYPVVVGAGAFVGAGVAIGPGAEIGPGEKVRAGEHVYPVFHKEKSSPPSSAPKNMETELCSD